MQKSVEAFSIGFFEDANLCAIHARLHHHAKRHATCTANKRGL
eukprot:CCRYP_004999-RA/>CCRYP_004999-RA protein AED:0.36 eAED:0.35 QI:0/-1/0/1/-1/0/1/0/42